MNILPKKSWHVRNKDNVEKVRRDEENARQEEKEQQRRAAIAEQEARTNHLREKARSRGLENSDDLKKLLKLDGKDPGSTSKDLVPANFFSDSSLERGATSLQKNAENEKEKKEEQVKYEKKIGLLVGLGQSAVETMDEADKPWYFRKPERISKKRSHSSSEEEYAEKDSKRKTALDPIQSMKSHLQKKKLSEENKKKHKKEKRKKKHKHKHRSPEREVVPRIKSSNDKLAKMREERLKREKKEHERTMLLLNGDKKQNPVETIRGKYNSQYNPHLVRQKTHHKHY